MGDEPSTERRDELTEQWIEGELFDDDLEVNHETVDPEDVEVEVIQE